MKTLCPVSTIPLPFFRCRFTIPVSRCRFRTSLTLPLPLRISMPNGTFVTEQWNFTTTERRNGNGRTATEWWKPGIRASPYNVIVGEKCSSRQRRVFGVRKGQRRFDLDGCWLNWGGLRLLRQRLTTWHANSRDAAMLWPSLRCTKR